MLLYFWWFSSPHCPESHAREQASPGVTFLRWGLLEPELALVSVLQAVPGGVSGVGLSWQGRSSASGASTRWVRL